MFFLLRFGAVSGLLAGLFIAVPGLIEAFTGETLATSLVLAVSPALAVPLLPALRLGLLAAGGQRRAVRPGGPGAADPFARAGGDDRAGVFADAAFAVNLIGLGLFGGAAYALNVVVYPLGDDTDLAAASRAALLVSASVFVVGVVMFGIALLRAGAYPRTPVWLYLLGFPPFAIAARLPDSPVTSALHVLVGGAVAWLALSCWRIGRASQAAPALGDPSAGVTAARSAAPRPLPAGPA
ncbi:hypothetical protein I6A84_01615 [Frankia sp. CNm7]|uniref:Uncharacterized protein n=1 Tax=Frankia nepalensis TaxID=1836974 RepID=A0A937UQ53_9ACTN|nr:hypothetical protein [Frankia nepalensis]MBL7498127.1 hypothetical protein [Frankia nepalensis]MBL7509355.1 hypothetical protein [Frankia nepalensis]MBL7516857.1 hypothetical protein [Frankia nepalensis]MBL7627915.1 hypothetical protein [Frankia nepalensis]